MSPTEIVGWVSLTDWFDCEPKFHDAEVVAVELAAGSPACSIRIHMWRTRAETDETGHFRTDRHAVVGIALDDLVTIELRGWMKQNVPFDLDIRPCAEGFSLTFDSCAGLEGTIVARNLRVEIAPWEA